MPETREQRLTRLANESSDPSVKGRLNAEAAKARARANQTPGRLLSRIDDLESLVGTLEARIEALENL